MNIDFLLFNPPKVSYDFMSLWGEVIFVPKREEVKKDRWPIASFLNCYKAHYEHEVELSLEAARLETHGIPPLQVQQLTSSTSTSQLNTANYQIKYNIPCLYLNSLVNSRYLILYFHSSGEDIKLSYSLANHLRNLYQINVVVMEYPGYSMYKGTASVSRVTEDAFTLYDYLVDSVGYAPQNIIIMGRSIGTGIAIEVAKRKCPAALVLISAFTSIKDIAKELVGSWSSFLVKDSFNNAEMIKEIKCPIFFLHGKADTFIKHQHSIDLARICCNNGNNRVKVELPSKMSHSSFDYYTDLSNPLRDFLLSLKIQLYDQKMNGPEMPGNVFKNPMIM